MTFIKHDLEKDFIMPLKAKRKVALSEQAKRDGAWARLDQVTLDANAPAGNLSGKGRFPALAGQASLRKRRWQYGYSISGVQRSDS